MRDCSRKPSFLHVFPGDAKQGRVSFLKMLKSFLLKYEYQSWQSDLQQAPSPRIQVKKHSPSYTDKVRHVKKPSPSYADKVKSHGSFNSSVSLNKKESTESQSSVEPGQESLSTSHLENLNTHQYWVRKSDDVLREDFNNLWIISRLFVFDDWKEITSFLQDFNNFIPLFFFLFVRNTNYTSSMKFLFTLFTDFKFYVCNGISKSLVPKSSYSQTK